ncbi:membrane-associated protein, putative [Bodo saltans]|uniref:Membrane-associated protein, putative n=1 Tax=Bodo saltans TaxID=75058 RepID=A0A0S4J316_BODSA|nr:membrane-associated protein, putative [Bodo saltans]|eukprot:CUG27294.1 membrane-associated protein, putative [Bodo saltans]
MRFPLWLGCAVLCAILVGLCGSLPLLLTKELSGKDVILFEARNSYNAAVAISSSAMYDKFINELIVTILAYSQAKFKPQLMTEVNVSTPSWDREWQLFFTGASVLFPHRRFYYFDLATGYFTGRYIGNDGATLRVVGSASNTNVTGYRRSVLPPFEFQPAEAISMLLPPEVICNAYLADPTGFVAIHLDPSGELIYAVGTMIEHSLADPTPAGVLLEVQPIGELFNTDAVRGAKVPQFGGDSIVLDDFGALVFSTYAALSDIYLPIGTPFAICTSAENANRTVSKCRHSVETIRNVWPVFYAAYQAFSARVEGLQIVNNVINVSYVTFSFEGQEYLVSATSPIESAGWWAAAITPLAPVYGLFSENQRRVVIILVVVAVSMAMLVLLCTYVLMLPLNALMDEMISALTLQRQADRQSFYARRRSGKGNASLSTVRAFLCCHTSLHMSELYEIEIAVESLHQRLGDIARMLPPPVIHAIRVSLAHSQRPVTQHALPMALPDDEVDMANSCEGASISMPQQLQGSSFEVDEQQPSEEDWAVRDQSQSNLDHLLTLFEDYYRTRGAVTPASSHNGISSTSSPSGPIGGAVLARETAREMFHNPSAAASNIVPNPVDDKERSNVKLTQSILVDASVSLRPKRRRGFFMAVSLVLFAGDPTEFYGIISPLLAIVWRHGGEVELIERELLLATFGCYDDSTDGAKRSVACAIEIVNEGQYVSPSSVISPARGHLAVAIDSGWFETANFSCALPSGPARCQLVAAVARHVAMKLLPLAELLDERLLVTGEVLRHVALSSIADRVPVVVDHVKFDARDWPTASRRRMIFVFALAQVRRVVKHAVVPAFSHILYEMLKCDAQSISEGFQLMVKAQYTDAALYFHNALSVAARGGRRANPHMRRLLDLCGGFMADAEGVQANMKPYFRTERTVFETGKSEFKMF